MYLYLLLITSYLFCTFALADSVISKETRDRWVQAANSKFEDRIEYKVQCDNVAFTIEGKSFELKRFRPSQSFSKGAEENIFPVVILQHGFKSSAFLMTAFGRDLAKIGFDVWLPNETLFQNSKELSERIFTLSSGVKAIVDPSAPWILMGHSWGAGAVVRATQKLEQHNAAPVIAAVLLDGSDSQPEKLLGEISKVKSPIVSISAVNAVFANMILERSKKFSANILLDTSHSALHFPLLPGYDLYLESAAIALIGQTLGHSDDNYSVFKQSIVRFKDKKKKVIFYYINT